VLVDLGEVSSFGSSELATAWVAFDAAERTLSMVDGWLDILGAVGKLEGLAGLLVRRGNELGQTVDFERRLKRSRKEFEVFKIGRFMGWELRGSLMCWRLFFRETGMWGV
jgi:hypothetical protein